MYIAVVSNKMFAPLKSAPISAKNFELPLITMSHM